MVATVAYQKQVVIKVSVQVKLLDVHLQGGNSILPRRVMHYSCITLNGPIDYQRLCQDNTDDSQSPQ